MGKGEIARYEQFLLFAQCFQKACFPEASKGVIVWEWVKQIPKYQPVEHHGPLVKDPKEKAFLSKKEKDHSYNQPSLTLYQTAKFWTTNLKAFTDDKVNVIEKLKFVWE